MYLSRSIRPNKYPKIKFKIGSKARLSPSLSFLLLRGKFKRSNVITQGASLRERCEIKILGLFSLLLKVQDDLSDPFYFSFGSKGKNVVCLF